MNSAIIDLDSLGRMLQDFVKDCDVSNYSWSKNVLATMFLAIFVAGFCCQIVTIPATWRIGGKRTAFLIMLNANIGHSIELLVYIGICLEYFLVGHNVQYPLDLDSYIHITMLSLIPFCYVVLALNRFVAVFMAIEYDKIFNSRSTNLWIGVCWLLSLLSGVGLNSKPELKAYHCVDQLVTVTLLTNDNVAQQSSYVVAIWTAYQYLSFFLAIMPMVPYVAVFVKMVIGQCFQKASSNSSASYHQNRDRARLFLISLLSTLPNFLMFLVTRMNFPIGNPVIDTLISILYKSLFILFQIHQPFLMFWLSMEFRREVIRDLGILARLIRKDKQNGVNVNISIPSKTILTKQAWN